MVTSIQENMPTTQVDSPELATQEAGITPSDLELSGLGDDFMQYWGTKRSQLKDDYKHPKGEPDNCGIIADTLAGFLDRNGKHPSIHEFWDSKTGYLAPVVYDDRVTWMRHFVCVAEGIAYDPMYDLPMPLETYVPTTFGDAPVQSSIRPYIPGVERYSANHRAYYA